MSTTTKTKTTTKSERAALVEFLRTRATVTTEPEHEDTDPEGHFDSGDADTDAALCATIRAESEWNVWAWCVVKVEAEYLGHTGTEYLGGCSYKDRAEFEQSDGYHGQMVDDALDALAHSILQEGDEFAELAAQLQPETRDADAKLGALVRETVAEYHLTKAPKLDKDGHEERSPLGDAMHRDGFRSLLRNARAGGLL